METAHPTHLGHVPPRVLPASSHPWAGLLPWASRAPPTLLQDHGPFIQASSLCWPPDQYLLLWPSGSFSPSLCLHLSLSASLFSLTSLSWVGVCLAGLLPSPYPGELMNRGQLPPSLPCPGLVPKSGQSWRGPVAGGDAPRIHPQSEGAHWPWQGPDSYWSPSQLSLSLFPPMTASSPLPAPSGPLVRWGCF